MSQRAHEFFICTIYVRTQECDGNTHQLTPLLFTKQTELCASCSTCSGSSSGTCSSGDIRLISRGALQLQITQTIFLFCFFLYYFALSVVVTRRRHFF